MKLCINNSFRDGTLELQNSWKNSLKCVNSWSLIININMAILYLPWRSFVCNISMQVCKHVKVFLWPSTHRLFYFSGLADESSFINSKWNSSGRIWASFLMSVYCFYSNKPLRLPPLLRQWSSYHLSPQSECICARISVAWGHGEGA